MNIFIPSYFVSPFPDFQVTEVRYYEYWQSLFLTVDCLKWIRYMAISLLFSDNPSKITCQKSTYKILKTINGNIRNAAAFVT